MTRWDRFYQKQMEDKELKALVEEELEALRIGAKIAALRDEEGLTQTKLAARTGMPSSKISALENSPHNLEIATLIRIARAANRKLQISFTPTTTTRMTKVTRRQRSKVRGRRKSGRRTQPLATIPAHVKPASPPVASRLPEPR